MPFVGLSSREIDFGAWYDCFHFKFNGGADNKLQAPRFDNQYHTLLEPSISRTYVSRGRGNYPK